MALTTMKSTFSPALENKKIYLCINNSDQILLESPPKPKITASSVSGSLKMHEFNIDIEDFKFNVTYFSYIDRLEVYVNHDSDINVDILSENEKTIHAQKTKIRASLFDTYTPTLGYTQKTKKTLSLIKAYANKNILPLIVVGTDTKFESYIVDTFKDIHFLDLSLLHFTSNKATREQIELNNEGKKRDDKEKLPKKEYEKIKILDNIIDFFLLLKDREYVIPTIRISLADNASLEYAKAINTLNAHFKKIALRIEIKKKNIKNLKSYLLPLASKLTDVYLILEIEPQKIKELHDELIEIKSITDDTQIILLGDNISKRDSIQDNKDIRVANQSLIAFKNLQSYHDNLIYADYCGLEKDTAVEPNGFLAQTAKIFYIDSNNLDEFYIRRERTSLNTWTSAMERLQNHINSTKPKEIIMSHCEACNDILSKLTTFSLGDIKENCIIHNGISISMA